MQNLVARVIAPHRSIRDKHTCPALQKQTDTLSATYVDNFAVFGLDPKLVDHQLNLIVKEFDKLGIATHENTAASSNTAFVGLQFHDCCVSIKNSRLTKLKYALDELLARSKCSRRMLEVIVGHISWAMMLFRPALTALNYVYSFGRDDPHALIKIPFEVRKELFQIRSILPLLRADVRSAWHPLVHASDASSTGFGVCSRWASPAYVGNLGRQIPIMFA